MIKYNLKCSSKTCKDIDPFDGWFQSIEAFDQQKKLGFLTCPYCGGNEIVKNLMSPSIKSTKKSKEKFSSSKIDDGKILNSKNKENKTSASKDSVHEFHAILRTLKKEIQKNAEYVGEKFVEEARAIKSGHSKDRSIYGNAEPEKIEELKEEGIEVSSIPWVQDDH